ncbi:hypothetical protein [Pararhizobium haloflavum]|uniref:hypothetical protein n=1 Tax=Pararhizobium haloflavum TaxID=2037914 RepID=UPI000C177041|nr:hypothetical protein [Pararhizobium haloflavum]
MKTRLEFGNNRLKSLIRDRRVYLLSTAVPLAAIAIVGAFFIGSDGPRADDTDPVPVAAVAQLPVSPADTETPKAPPAETAGLVNAENKTARPLERTGVEVGEEQAGSEPDAGIAESDLRLTPLADDNPRWRDDTQTSDTEGEGAELAAALTGTADDDAARASPGEPAAETGGLDRATTAAIADDGLRGSETVEIAETDAEIAALEAAAAAAQTDMPNAAFVGSVDLIPARVKEYVNFRTAPDNGSDVIRVLPGGTEIDAQPLDQCVHFCQVTVDGEPGYIGKTFIAYEDTVADAQ